eukprot:CAMPEP_0182483416 /NCGR_PEP_ID=MMETSP1319-20130603/41291_1 /TAXON_ID=172717 /ORGANISM="Bolidomonas pacifica, Strain RCC208" /LENGTH=53 /DNA_ID=CAMNT_0024685219 /DNA_START=51 /DNA_END=209 /DNA_ORIENTATION=+
MTLAFSSSQPLFLRVERTSPTGLPPMTSLMPPTTSFTILPSEDLRWDMRLGSE